MAPSRAPRAGTSGRWPPGCATPAALPIDGPMTRKAEPLTPPPRQCNAEGAPRLVGMEFEFAGVGLETTASLVRDLYGGEVRFGGAFQCEVRETELGSFTVELDARALKDRAYLQVLQRVGIDLERDEQDWLDHVLARLAATIVPHEVVCPPVPLPKAHRLEELREALRQAGAQGTHAAVHYAFGLHINAEAPALDATTLVSVLKAYLLLRDALRRFGATDLSRRLSQFIKDFPEPYARQVVAPDYWPDVAGFIRDYLAANPTRNRALDLLPLFAHIDRDALPPALRDDPLVKARPAFHYRLPNCAVDEPDWTLAREWRHWVAVERLAEDREALERLGAGYLERRDEPLTGIHAAWALETAAWLTGDP